MKERDLETLREGWENGGGPRVSMGIPFCGRRFVIGNVRTVCHSLQGHENAGFRTHQVAFRGMLLEVDDGGLLA